MVLPFRHCYGQPPSFSPFSVSWPLWLSALSSCSEGPPLIVGLHAYCLILWFYSRRSGITEFMDHSSLGRSSSGKYFVSVFIARRNVACDFWCTSKFRDLQWAPLFCRLSEEKIFWHTVLVQCCSVGSMCLVPIWCLRLVLADESQYYRRKHSDRENYPHFWKVI